MGIFSPPEISAPPPPPPVPPAAHAPTLADAGVQATGAQARARAAAAAGQGMSGTNLTKPGATGAVETGKAQLLGDTSK